MTIRDIIRRKKKGLQLSCDEIEYFVKGTLSGEIADYQASALLMAICLKGFSFEETVCLTRAMRFSGEQADLSCYSGVKIDKHSTGGVGDSTSFLVMPILGALGYKCVKMSGRGLGHTGGTLDKLDAIGVDTSIPTDKLREQIDKIGFAIIGQTLNMCPADKYLYALRDVTETVDSIPLIASSIMSKKLASGGDLIVLDVKYGKGAFMTSFADAVELAETMCAIGRAEGKKTIALISDMNEPLSSCVGNAIEVEGAIKALSGEKGKLRDLSIALSANALSVAEGIDYAKAFEKVVDVLDSGLALKFFEEMVKAQGGNLDIKKAEFNFDVTAKSSGFIHEIDALKIGDFVCDLGGGRRKKDDLIDYGVGVILNVRVGDKINQGDKLLTVYSKEPINEEQLKRVYDIFSIKSESLDKPRLVYAKINELGEISI